MTSVPEPPSDIEANFELYLEDLQTAITVGMEFTITELLELSLSAETELVTSDESRHLQDCSLLRCLASLAEGAQNAELLMSFLKEFNTDCDELSRHLAVAKALLDVDSGLCRQGPPPNDVRIESDASPDSRVVVGDICEQTAKNFITPGSRPLGTEFSSSIPSDEALPLQTNVCVVHTTAIQVRTPMVIRPSSEHGYLSAVQSAKVAHPRVIAPPAVRRGCLPTLLVSRTVAPMVISHRLPGQKISSNAVPQTWSRDASLGELQARGGSYMQQNYCSAGGRRCMTIRPLRQHGIVQYAQ